MRVFLRRMDLRQHRKNGDDRQLARLHRQHEYGRSTLLQTRFPARPVGRSDGANGRPGNTAMGLSTPVTGKLKLASEFYPAGRQYHAV